MRSRWADRFRDIADSSRRSHHAALTSGIVPVNSTAPSTLRRFAWPLVIAVALLAGLAWWLRDRDDGGARYRTDPVARGDLSVAISATGNLEALSTVEVST